MRNQYVSWTTYLNSVSVGSNPDATRARLCLRLKCSTAAAALRKLRRLLVRQRISNSTYRLYREAVDRIDYMLQKGMHCAVVEHDLGDWIALGNGGYRRKIHTSTIVLRPFLN